MNEQNALLELRDVRAGYGAGPVLHGVSLTVRAGEVVGLLGRNGMGKSTTLKGVLGLARVHGGSIRFRGEELTRKAPYEIPRLGIGYVPQGRRVFPELTVLENLWLGLSAGGRGARPEQGPGRRRLDEVLARFPALGARLKQKAGTLSGGEQQMLAIARALLMGPRLLLLDEPTEGLMPQLVARTERLLLELKDQGLGLLMAEQRLETALRLCDRLYVLEKGRIVWAGDRRDAHPEALRRALGLGA